MRLLLASTQAGNPQEAMYRKALTRGLGPTTAAEFAAAEGHVEEVAEGLLKIAEDPRLPEALLPKVNEIFLMALAARANNLVFIDRVGPPTDPPKEEQK
jgi:hypothetical protein